jgi:hypothetical protein
MIDEVYFPRDLDCMQTCNSKLIDSITYDSKPFELACAYNFIFHNIMIHTIMIHNSMKKG